jgi:hypothetical protein
MKQIIQHQFTEGIVIVVKRKTIKPRRQCDAAAMRSATGAMPDRRDSWNTRLSQPSRLARQGAPSHLVGPMWRGQPRERMISVG